MLASAAFNKVVFPFCLLSLFSSTAIAGAEGQGGVIHFTGQVVESPCEVSRVEKRLTMSCERQGQLDTHYYSPQTLLHSPQRFKQIATANMRYLDKQQTLAVVSIDYR